MSIFYPFEVVGRGSGAQLQVGIKIHLNDLILRPKGYNIIIYCD